MDILAYRVLDRLKLINGSRLITGAELGELCGVKDRKIREEAIKPLRLAGYLIYSKLEGKKMGYKLTNNPNEVQEVIALFERLIDSHEAVIAGLRRGLAKIEAVPAGELRLI